MTFVERLRQYFFDHPEDSPSNLAIRAGLDNSVVRRMLEREGNPRIDTAEKITSAMGTTLSRFLADQSEHEVDELVELLSQLNSEERQFLINAAKAQLTARDGEYHW